MPLGVTGMASSPGDVEVILETYLHESGNVTSALRSLSVSLERTAVELSFQMDAARNRLLHFEVVATSVGTAMSVGAVISGILGMNLKTDLFNKDEWVFDFVAVGIVVCCFVTSGVLLCLLRCDFGEVRALAQGRSTLFNPLDLNPADRPPTWVHVGARESAGTRGGTQDTYWRS